MNSGEPRGTPRGDGLGIATLVLVLIAFSVLLWAADHFVDVSPLADAADSAEPVLSWFGIIFAIVVIVLAVFVYPVYLRRS